MPTTFIALQCYQCSTMQVKQQKKSSNKWCCVVCNEKQSVRKVYAQAFMAKDVRKFVQSFNMSRQFEEETQTLTQTQIEHNHNQQQPLNNRDKKRTDWSEYIDLQDEKVNQIDEDEDEGDEFEPKVVTELPKELFKKSKLNNYGDSSERGDSKKTFKPVFGKRNNKSQTDCQAAEPSEYHSTVWKEEVYDGYRLQKEDLFPSKESVRVELTERVSKKKINGIQNDNDGPENGVSMRCLSSNTRVGSKWSEYLAEDDDDADKELMDPRGNMNSDAFELVFEDQRVDEDVHPDFL